jgi:nucleoside 2-deoxyribosyltransferase
MSEPWEDHARRELGPKMASSAFVITIDPGAEIDPKIALETGYAVLLGKPIIVVCAPGTTSNAGLARIATHRIDLTHDLDTMAGQAELQAGLRRVRG